jgi:hypothetical protein
MTDTPLENIPNWSKEHISRMKEAWVTTAEQVVALGATEGGLTSIAEQLSISEDAARKLVESASAVLSPDALEKMGQPSETDEYGLGALPLSHEKDR